MIATSPPNQLDSHGSDLTDKRSETPTLIADLQAKGVTFLDYTEGPLITTDHVAQLGPARAHGSPTRTGTPSACGRANSLIPRVSSGRLAARRTKINGSDPPLTAGYTAYATPPFLPLSHPPIELAYWPPRGCLNLDWWVDFPAVCFGTRCCTSSSLRSKSD